MASDLRSATATTVLQLRITLRGLSPPVWRRVLVSENMTLLQLHEIIQMVMETAQIMNDLLVWTFYLAVTAAAMVAGARWALTRDPLYRDAL